MSGAQRPLGGLASPVVVGEQLGGVATVSGWLLLAAGCHLRRIAKPGPS